MDELVRWLGKQLDEGERIARVAATLPVPVVGAMNWRSTAGLPDDGGSYWCISTTPPDDTVPTVELVGSGMSGGGVHEEAVARHIAEWDPARVLREIEAKRDLLRLAQRAHDYPETFMNGFASALEGTLRLFAAAYADRPGYLESWRP